MKKLLYTLLCCIFCAGMTQAQVQYPQNGGFETWLVGNFSGFTYDTIEYWDTPQRLAVALSVPDTVTYQESSVVNGGAFAARLVTKFVSIGGALDVNVPGSLATGNFFVNIFAAEFGVVGGADIDCTPTNLTGYYQYFPVNDDTAQVQCRMMNAAGDTIQDSTIFFIGETSTYTQWDMPLNYTSTDEPAMLQIIILSSAVDGQVGSTMYVDDVVLSGGDCFTGIFNPGQPLTTMDVLPNPTSSTLQVDYPGTKAEMMTVYDVVGKAYQQQLAEPGANFIDVSDLPEGLYFIRIQGEDGMTYSGRFNKQ